MGTIARQCSLFLPCSAPVKQLWGLGRVAVLNSWSKPLLGSCIVQIIGQMSQKAANVFLSRVWTPHFVVQAIGMSKRDNWTQLDLYHIVLWVRVPFIWLITAVNYMHLPLKWPSWSKMQILGKLTELAGMKVEQGSSSGLYTVILFYRTFGWGCYPCWSFLLS